jgi:hypothetical protein
MIVATKILICKIYIKKPVDAAKFKLLVDRVISWCNIQTHASNLNNNLIHKKWRINHNKIHQRIVPKPNNLAFNY